MVFLKPTVLRTDAERSRDHLGALRIPAGASSSGIAPGIASVLARSDEARSCRREGKMPGMPGAPTPAPPLAAASVGAVHAQAGRNGAAAQVR